MYVFGSNVLNSFIVSDICFATSTVSDKSYTFVELGQISESLSDFSKGRNFFKTIVLHFKNKSWFRFDHP